jgi:hypothetical protein
MKLTTDWIHFKTHSVYIWATTDGEVIEKKLKPQDQDFPKKNPLPSTITWPLWKRWEKIISVLLPGSKVLGRPTDVLSQSAFDEREIAIEVKTNKVWNTGVIRPGQVQRYIADYGLSHAYFAQIFYNRSARRFVPELIYFFPIPFMVYLINTSEPIWTKPSTQFHALRILQANQLVEVARRQVDFIVREFITPWLKENPNAKLCIVDYMQSPHILSRI